MFWVLSTTVSEVIKCAEVAFKLQLWTAHKVHLSLGIHAFFRRQSSFSQLFLQLSNLFSIFSSSSSTGDHCL